MLIAGIGPGSPAGSPPVGGVVCVAATTVGGPDIILLGGVGGVAAASASAPGSPPVGQVAWPPPWTAVGDWKRVPNVVGGREAVGFKGYTAL